ncbi:cytochrome P450 [Streptomyces sp. NPDC046870]|uniref:cytochrome P450 n=1 Tax=Streptomyces sp. NPDC046870 TaxID=3155135 RepID=UPI0034553426
MQHDDNPPAPAAAPRRPFVPPDPLGWFDAARETTPVLWHPQTASWYVTRYADVWDLLADNRLLARTPEPFLEELTEEQRTAAAPLVDFLARWPMFLDPPRHAVVRRVVRPAFAPAEVTRVAAVVRAGLPAGALLPDGPDGAADLLDSLLRPACEAALGGLLGVSREELSLLAAWSGRLMGFVGRQTRLATILAAREALDLFTDFVERACLARTSPLAIAVDRAVRDGSLTRTDAVAVYAQLVTGALEPTVATLAVALEQLTADPGLRDGYRADPDGFVTEAVRLATPFHFAPRRAATEIVLRDQRIPAGDRVVLVLVAANRDPRQFPDPLEFRWDRRLPHVAFGRGRHACLGRPMAHQVLRAVLDAVLSGPQEPPRISAEWEIGMGMRALRRVGQAVVS